MKIAVTARLLGGRLEGIGHYTNELLSRLVIANPQDEWHIIYDRNVDRLLIDAPNVKNYFIGPPTRHPLLISFWLDYRLPVLLRRINPDIVWYPDGLMSLAHKGKSVLTIHDLAYLSYPQGSRKRDLRFYKKNIPKYIDKADQVITISNFSKDLIGEHFVKNSNKTEVIYNGYSSNYKPRSEEQKRSFRKSYTNGHPYFLHLGAIHPRKNVLSLIKGFEQFKKEDNDYKLILAGRMAWKSNDIKKAISTSAYQKDIIHLDQIDDIIYDLVGSAEGLCSLSLVEGFGLPVLEAMASGVPVVVSKDSAMAEVAGNAATLCEPTDLKEIAKALETLTIESTDLQQKRKLGFIRSSAFDWDKARREVYTVLQNIGHRTFS